MRRPLMLLLAAVLLLAACQAPAAAPTQAPAQKPAEQQPAAAQPTAAPAIPQQPPAQPAPATSAPLATAQPKAGPSQSGGVLTPPTSVPTPGNNPANVDTPPKGWVKLESKSTPPARYDQAMSVISDAYSLLLFGGRDHESVLGDTWLCILPTDEWQNRTSKAAPRPRYETDIGYISSEGKYLLFGGRSNDTFFNDMWWTYGFDDWSEFRTTGSKPTPRADASVVTAEFTSGTPLDGILIVSHGYSDRGYFDDTYILDLKARSWQKVSSTKRPSPRAGQAATADDQRGQMYLFGGYNAQGQLLNDLWIFDPLKKVWTELRPTGRKPASRADATLTYDFSGHLWLFGGRTQVGPANDLWRYDIASAQWALFTSSNGPQPRSNHKAIRDYALNIVIFGGQDANGNALNDLWQFTP